MDCYIDASGKPDFGSPGFFVLVCVFYDMNAGDTQVITEKVLKSATRKDEIRFAKMRHRDRLALSRLLAPLPFRYSSFVADTMSPMTAVSQTARQADELLQLAVSTTLRNAVGLHYPNIIMDHDTSSSAAKRIQARLNQFLQRRLSTFPVVSNLTLADSKTHPSIQLADFLAGVIRQHHFPSCKPSEQSDCVEMFGSIQHKGFNAAWNLSP